MGNWGLGTGVPESEKKNREKTYIVTSSKTSFYPVYLFHQQIYSFHFALVIIIVLQFSRLSGHATIIFSYYVHARDGFLPNTPHENLQLGSNLRRSTLPQEPNAGSARYLR